MKCGAGRLDCPTRSGRRPYFLVLAVQLLSGSSSAQGDTACVAGIYRTAGDLVQGRLEHRINTGLENYKFDFLFPADLKLTIRIQKPDTTLEFPPDSVYGYRRCERDFRYFQGGGLLAQEDFYRIEEKGGLIIYTSAFVSGNEVFYSRDLSSPIRRLLIRNIREDFGKDARFTKGAEDLNRQGPRGELGKRDEHGNYLINQIYKRTGGG